MIRYQSNGFSFYQLFSLLPELKKIDPYYPDITQWYVEKCIPGIILGNDQLIIATEHDHLVGFSLGKKSKDENKLRCVRVNDDYQYRGVGIRLIDRMMDLIEDDRPVVTVAEELIHDYSRIFVNRYRYSLEHITKGQYRPNKLEYHFNLN